MGALLTIFSVLSIDVLAQLIHDWADIVWQGRAPHVSGKRIGERVCFGIRAASRNPFACGDDGFLDGHYAVEVGDQPPVCRLGNERECGAHVSEDFTEYFFVDFDGRTHLDMRPIGKGAADVAALADDDSSEEFAGHHFPPEDLAGGASPFGETARLSGGWHLQIGQVRKQETVTDGDVALAPRFELLVDERCVLIAEDGHVGYDPDVSRDLRKRQIRVI